VSQGKQRGRIFYSHMPKASHCYVLDRWQPLGFIRQNLFFPLPPLPKRTNEILHSDTSERLDRTWFPGLWSMGIIKPLPTDACHCLFWEIYKNYIY